MSLNLSHDRANNFDALRLLGALMVLIGHAFPLHGRERLPLVFGSGFAELGVVIFFSISGFLVASSWAGDPRPLAYLRKRSLRIFPALAVVTLLSIGVLGPLVTELGPRAYASSATTWQYLLNIVLNPQYVLPATFGELPYPNVVNGSLWTLPVEFACYLIVPLVFFVPQRARAAAFLALALAFGIAAQIMAAAEVGVILYGSSLGQALEVWPFFMVGAALATAKGRIQLRLDVALGALFVTTLLGAVSPASASYVWWFVLPYAVVALGSERTPVISRAGRFGDFSYGLYLYAFPVQQLVIFVAPELPFAVSVLFALVATLALAIASWHLVEKQALRLKGSRPALRVE